MRIHNRILISFLLVAASFIAILTIWKSNREFNRVRPAIGTNPDTNTQLADEVPVLTIALLSDSHNFNDNLQTALEIAKEKRSNYVIHLGDLSNVGTMSELSAVKNLLDQPGISYYVIPGDHEYYVSEWDNSPMIENFAKVFGNPPTFVLLSYDEDGSSNVKARISNQYKSSNVKIEGEFIFTHEPLYPLGKDQELLEKVRKSNVKAVIAGDAHFSSETLDPVRSSLSHIVIGALTEERNLQTPRFSILRIYDNGEYNVEEIVL